MRTVLCIGVLLTGCFYLDPINQKPKIDRVDCKVTIMGSDRPCLPNVHRGDLMELDVIFIDPEHREAAASFDWKAFHCTDGEARDCSRIPFDDAKTPQFKIEIPGTLRGVPAIRVEVELRDELGASAGLTPSYLINDPPTLEVDNTDHPLVVGGPVELYAKVGDLDEGPDRIEIRWDVIAPAPSAVPLEDLAYIPDVNDPSTRTDAKLLVPDRVGFWDVRIRATDTMPEFPETTEDHLTFTVGPDEPPCLAQSLPMVPPDGASVPIAEPTLFQVAVVVDDLDPFPPLSHAPRATTEFEWSILAPGGPGRQILTGATGNSVDFDPSAFTPGEIVELRVEISDRTTRAIPCADEVAACAIVAESACIQRQTWRVEVR